jgi:hypothetical protein
MAYDFNSLLSLGINRDDAESLRRIAMTLHRWYEMECGTNHGAYERDEVTGKVHYRNAYDGKLSRYTVPDRETGALKRLAKIMQNYPTLSAYVQGDPRGAALYIVRPDDVPAGCDIEGYYSRGIAVYK